MNSLTKDPANSEQVWFPESLYNGWLADSLVLMTASLLFYHMTRVESTNESARIGSGISTRTSVEMSGLLYDGFGLEEAANVCVYPQYDNTGGVDSERTFVKQIVQKFIDDGSNDELFNEEEVETATAV